jgi:hypothetical protein
MNESQSEKGFAVGHFGSLAPSDGERVKERGVSEILSFLVASEGCVVPVAGRSTANR